jgi:cell wall-associated NlpC family hydrolase
MGLDNVKVEKFITAAMKYKGDKYSQPKRLQKGFSDCSSLIQKALNDINLNTRKDVTVTTHRMGIEGDSRFRQIPKSQIQRGDVLWGGGYVNGRWEGHVAIYLGDGKTLEARVREGVDYNKDRPYFTRAYRIKALEETEIKVENKQLQGKTTANLNVRSLNSTKGSILKTLKKGASVDIEGVAENGWYKLKEGGFVSPNYVSIDKPIENVDVLINGKNVKKGYIVNGITYITINGKDLPVRQLFENMGAKVEWKNNRVEITL